MIKYPKNGYGTEKYMKCCNFFTNQHLIMLNHIGSLVLSIYVKLGSEMVKYSNYDQKEGKNGNLAKKIRSAR